MSKIYYESLEEAIERNKPNIASTKRKLEDALEGMGADPERESETRASYSPENVYD